MFCVKCGKEIKDSSSFCSSCGYDLSSSHIKDVEKSDDKASIWLLASVTLLPLIGLIVAIKDHNEYPKRARLCIIYAIVASVIYYYLF